MMKSYYKQKKTTRASDAVKPSPSSKSIKKKSPAVAQPITPRHDDDVVETSEQMLREFDMNMAYGPCIGMTRSARWERAHRLGLNPSGEIKNLLDAGNGNAQSIWDGRV
ncbi:DNA polymerase delta subunit 4 [Linum grandiflorum]